MSRRLRTTGLAEIADLMLARTANVLLAVTASVDGASRPSDQHQHGREVLPARHIPTPPGLPASRNPGLPTTT